MSKAEHIQIPLKLRLRAWWEGYDLDDVKDRLKALQDGEAPDDSPAKSKSSHMGKAPDEKTLIIPWDKIRMDMTQLIWGDGYCGPGGRKHIETLSKLLSMNSEMSALVIGAGLGGPARVLAEEFGVWITGYELSPELAKKGMQMSIDAGLGSKAVIKHIDPEKINPFDRRYDRAFSKESLYCFPNKPKILNDIFETLKEGALFLITDYTISDLSALENHDVQKWLKQEAARPFPITSEKMKTFLEEAGFSIRVNEDISNDYLGLIEKSWSKAETVAKHLAEKGEEATEAIQSLMTEAEFWSLRAKLLKKRLIQVRRFLAHKPNKPIR